MSATRPPHLPRSILTLLFGLILAGSVLAVAVGGAYFLFTGRLPLPPPALEPGAENAAEPALPPGEPTLSAGVEPIATPTSPARSSPTATTTPITPTATPEPTTQPPVRAVITGDVVNLRSGPGTDYPVIGQVRLGQPYRATARNRTGDWLEICCPTAEEQSAWISAQFLAVTAPVETLPVEEVPPPPASETPLLPAQTDNQTANPAAALARPAAGLPGPGRFGPPGDLNPLTGLPLAGADRTRRPLIVCINNDYAARPQFGTSRAALVYEYLMEGYSITRFSAVFYREGSDQIGPIRSARLINLSLGALYDAGLACSGASDPVRFALKNDAPFPYLDIDLDDPSNNRYSVSLGSDYRTRLRTSTDRLHRWLADWGVEKAPSVRGFSFGEVLDGGAPASAISIPYPSVTGSQVAYRYDAGSGRYLRFLGGAPHLDANNGTQLALDNVIVQYVPHEATEIVEDSLGSKSIQLNLFGSGRALIFRNGVGFEATWRSESRGDLPRFFDSAGREIALKPGNSWVSVVPLTYAIAYQ